MSEETKDAAPKRVTILEWLKAKLEQIIPGERTKGAKYVAEHPTEFGFTWGSGAVGKGVGKAYRELRADAPHIVVTPELLPQFIATWGPKKVADAMGGQSIKVACDRVNRDTIDKARGTANAVLKEKIILSVLYGVVTRNVVERVVTQTKWVVNGVEYTNEAEAKLAMTASEQEATEKAREFVDMAVGKGMSMENALEMAKLAFPTANFGTSSDEDEEQEETEE